MMKKACSYITLVFLTACQWVEPSIKTLKVCQKPTAINAVVSANNSRQYTFSLVGLTTELVFPINWKQGSYTIGSSSTSSINYTFTGDGNFVITAEAATVCGEKVTLTSNVVVKACVLPTEITVTTDPLDVRKFSFGIKTNAPSDVSSVVWRTVSQYKDQAHGSLKVTDNVNYTVNSSEVVAVTATVQTVCGQTVTLTKNVSAEFKVWDKTFGGSGIEEMTTMIATSDGGYLLGGSSKSSISGDKSESNKGDFDYWVIKVSSSGQKQWDRTFGGVYEDKLSGLIQTSDGGYLLSGQSSSPSGGDKTENSRGGLDYWIVKINANGQKQWDKTYGGNNTEYHGKAIATSDGGFLIIGHSASVISNEKSENNKGDWDWWIVKTNSTGQKQWDKTFGGFGEDYIDVSVQTPDGGYLLGGNSNSNISGDKSENSRGSFDFWVVKINANGQKQWDKTYGGNDRDILKSVHRNADGSFLIGGYSHSNISGEKSENPRGGQAPDFWLININPNGQKQWDKIYGGSNSEGIYGITNLADGDVFLVGDSFSGTSSDKSENSFGDWDFWTLKVKANGQKVWDKAFGGSARDQPKAVVVGADGGVLVGGESTSNKSGEKSENNRGESDFWVVKIR